MDKNTLNKLINDTESRIGRIFTFCIQGLIVLSVITFSVETVPDLPAWMMPILKAVEIITVLIFTVEYILRIYVAQRKLSFIFSFFGLVDLLSILPFYLCIGIDLWAIRIVRLLRLFRILKLARYSKAIQHFKRAFMLIKAELVVFFSTTCLLIYLSAEGIYFFENPAQPEKFKSIFHCLWWALETLTTVGYGDIYPITAGGKVFTFFVLMIGLFIVTVPAGLFASALTRTRMDEEHHHDQAQHGQIGQAG